jgi:hypothetical protein
MSEPNLDDVIIETEQSTPITVSTRNTQARR